MNEELLLEGLFREVVRRGLRLGVRDYLDAVRALRLGYGHGTRERLAWLCQMLWASGDEERRLVRGAFAAIASPTPEDVRRALGEEEPPERTPREREVVKPRERSPEGEASEESGETTPASVGIDFASKASGGTSIPRAAVESVPEDAFVLDPPALVPHRNLVIAWRRYRRAQRTGPRTELDLEATIDLRSRAGVVPEPVLVAERRNTARLVVLVDVSPSMAPWRAFQDTLADSLLEGRLGEGAIWYFDNTPDAILFKDPDVRKPVPLATCLRASSPAGAIVVSDAGSARGAARRDVVAERVASTREFLARVAGHWQPIAWLNPMPRVRWRGSAASELARLRGVSMFELTDAGVIAAVDVLRGRPATGGAAA